MRIFNFKISSAPLIKVSILKVSKNKHILLLTLHHIITDQWSMEILKEELAFNYKKLSSGLQPEITAKMNIKKVDLYISLKIERKIRIIIAGIL